MDRIHSLDGVTIAVHDLAGDASRSPLLVSHATGFHARCYLPMAAALGDRYHVLGLDHRGHGASTLPDGWDVDWSRFGTDTLRVAEAIAPDGGLAGVGHSMGGASLLMAAHTRPGLFAHLTLFEPVAHPSNSDLADVDMRSLPIVQGALRRRRRFASIREAVDNYVDKPPLSVLVPDALAQYVEHGFRPVVDEDGAPAVELCCTPELEAGIFVGGRDNGVWELLAEIETPCTVIGGRVEERQPSSKTRPIAEQLPHGRYLLLDHHDHFGPLSHPDEIAALVP